ncbi:MAG: alanine--glyoxylate aminotransferase [Candidatus Aminicenantes bacterium 4484_214]|nr:MAG: alanine--glyoxylate aminotransferase [Candidatus Aminicenantes bacterium 4484_214]
MSNLLDEIEEITLMGPGPSCIYPEVYRALSRPTLGHLDPYFIQIMDGIKELLQVVMKTKNRLTIPISGTGSAGMEACFVNLIERGDPVLILINGVFGTRMKDVAGRLGAQVDTLEFEWGKPIDVEMVAQKLKDKFYKIVAVVHAETSTGVRNPVAEIGELLKGKETLYLVDAVTSLGGIEIATDDWGIDALYSGSQKCLSCPPGLAPATFSERALEVILNRQTKVPNWYLDMSMIAQYWEGKKRVYHHTAPINMLYALYQSLYLIVEEGLENVFRRHQEMHQKLVAGLEELGIKMLVDPPYRLPQLNAILIPEGIDDAQGRAWLLEKYKIEIGGGLGPLAGKIWRIGLMGYTAREENVNKVLEALGEVVNQK